MTIISISLNDTILEEIDKIQQEQGFSSRSEVIRAGVRVLISENKYTENLSGKINSTLLLVHSHDDENTVSKIKHKFEDITTTQIHSHLKNNKCLEIFILEGDSDRIKELIRQFKTSKKMDLIKLIVA
jgi:CopG family nickel-responsive transcriptional regulator